MTNEKTMTVQEARAMARELWMAGNESQAMQLCKDIATCIEGTNFTKEVNIMTRENKVEQVKDVGRKAVTEAKVHGGVILEAAGKVGAGAANVAGQGARLAGQGIGSLLRSTGKVAGGAVSSFMAGYNKGRK